MKRRAVATRALVVALAAIVGLAARSPTLHDTPAPAPLDVLPYPGTPDASPQTQIHFPALVPSQLKAVTVNASRSGPHAGRLTALPGHAGTAFVPDRPFTSGDRVIVHATLRSRAAGTASGARGATQLSFGFTVQTPIDLDASTASDGATASPAAAPRLNPATFTASYHSVPSLHPPIVVATHDPDTRSGDIFLDAQRSTQAGPLILNPQGRVLWFDPLTGGNAAFNVEVQHYQGQSVLTFWQGHVSDGWGRGDDVILNHSYQTIATVHGVGYQTDLHEFAITPQGNALVTAYAPVHANLSSVGGSKHGILLDSIIQEINIRTGALIWEWHAYGHVPLADSYAGKPNSNPYDFFHINSIQQLPNGNFLVSARQTFAVYEISHKTGRIVWTLGGKHSSFKIGHGAHFQWQHDARHEPGGDITVFDNGDGYGRSARQSRGLVIHLNMKRRTATLVHSYAHHPPTLSDSEGDLQELPNHKVFVGFGDAPEFAEYTRTGRQLFTARFLYPVQLYRAFRFQWTGTPTSAPAIAASPSGTGTTVYASWNGATDVSSWRVLAGPSASALTQVAQSPLRGFETGISTSSTGPFFIVQAIGSAGQVLGSSAVTQR